MKKLLNVAVIALGLVAGAGLVALNTQSVNAAAGYAAPAKLGETAPDFALKDLDGKDVKLADFKGKVVVLEWFNPGCPFVVKHHSTFDTMRKTAKDFKDKGVVWLAINSGAEGKQGASKEENTKARTDWKIEYPIVLDPTGVTGKAYGAKTTPHMFIIDKEGKLVYAGAIDNDSSPKKQGSKNYVKNALDEVLAGKKVTDASNDSYGCGVKYGK